MLNKLQIAGVVAVLLAVLRSFGVEAPEEFGKALTIFIDSALALIGIALGWWTTESRAKIQKLKTKP